MWGGGSSSIPRPLETPGTTLFSLTKRTIPTEFLDRFLILKPVLQHLSRTYNFFHANFSSFLILLSTVHMTAIVYSRVAYCYSNHSTQYSTNSNSYTSTTAGGYVSHSLAQHACSLQVPLISSQHQGHPTVCSIPQIRTWRTHRPQPRTARASPPCFDYKRPTSRASNRLLCTPTSLLPHF